MLRQCSIIFALFFAMLGQMRLEAQFYNGSQIDFGQNRIQYKSQEWGFYRYENYDVFFYAGGKELSHLAARHAHEYVKSLEVRFNYELVNRLQIILFNRLSDLRQSNLGTLPDMENNPGGMARQAGNKILIYYENGTVPFLQQIESGIASAFVQELLYGSNLKERMRSGTVLSIPYWYEKGLVKYLSESWDARQISMVRDGLESGRYFHLNRLEGEEAEVAGFSMWSFFARNYGEKIIADIVALTSDYRSADQGIQMALAQPVKMVWQEWLNYLDKTLLTPNFKPQKDVSVKMTGKNRKGFLYGQMRFSYDGKHLAYVRNDKGRKSIWLYTIETGKRKKIISLGRRLPGIQDASFPVLAWNPNNEMLVYSDEYKGRLRLNYLNIISGETEHKFIDEVQKINHFSIAPDGKRYAMIASRDGQTDLFLFNNLSNTFEPLTNDLWDEAGAEWMGLTEKIIFTSNRNNDSLQFAAATAIKDFKTHDIFVYELNGDRKTVKRLLNTPQVNEQQPLVLPDGKVAWLSDENGINNRYIGRPDSAISFIDTTIHYRYFMVNRPATHYGQSIIEHAQNKDGSAVELRYSKGRLTLHRIQADSLWPENSKLPKAGVLESSAKKPQKQGSASGESKPKLKKIFVFGSRNGQEAKERAAVQDSFKISRQRVYERAWYADYLMSRIDRSFFNQIYQPYSGSGYFNAPLSSMFRMGIADLFEDFRITGGVRLAGNLTGNEYMIAFQNFKYRLDRTLILHRQGIQTAEYDGTRAMAHSAIGKISYAFSEVSRISAGLSFRHDRITYLSLDLANLNRSNNYRYWTQAKAEYVFDNCFPAGNNLLMGTRAKITGEYFRNINDKNQAVWVLGTDVRHYYRIDREMILALRAAAGTSMGPGKLLFYLGGVDSWLLPRFENSAMPDPSQNYLFQTIATNVRGFGQNARNGNSFGVANAEFRWNFVRYFSRFTLRSEFFNSLQVIGFTDVGTAFTGPSPYSDENTFNQRTIQSGPITVVLKNQEEPIIWGYGFGLRAKLLGYFVRADLGYGINDGRRLPSVFYLSLCNDF